MSVSDIKGLARIDERSVQPGWCRRLPLQQQSVLLLAARGPDGVDKLHPCKDVVRAYRGTVLVAAKYGRPLHWGERADTFMDLGLICHEEMWGSIVEAFYTSVDSLPLHYVMHLLHGAEILGYKHPLLGMRERWLFFYTRGIECFHLNHETERQMDERLSDWGRRSWGTRWAQE